LDFSSFNAPGPGQSYRPTPTADVLFNQRCVPALLIPVIGFGILSAFTPFEIGVGLWAAIALFVLPGIIGLIIHSIGHSVSTNQRAKRAFILNLVAFVIYGIVSMSIIHDRIQAPVDGFGVLPAMLVSAIGYGFVAGVVAGFMASLPVHSHSEQGY
jgi:hypothetical protein